MCNLIDRNNAIKRDLILHFVEIISDIMYNNINSCNNTIIHLLNLDIYYISYLSVHFYSFKHPMYCSLNSSRYVFVYSAPKSDYKAVFGLASITISHNSNIHIILNAFFHAKSHRVSVIRSTPEMHDQVVQIFFFLTVPVYSSSVRY